MNADKKEQKSKKYKIDQQKEITKSKFKLLKIDKFLEILIKNKKKTKCPISEMKSL